MAGTDWVADSHAMTLSDRVGRLGSKPLDLWITGGGYAVVLSADPDDFRLLLDRYDVKISQVWL